MNFSDLGLSEKTIQAIDEFGIKEPTTVQTDVIPSILQGKDVFTIAPAGCGKTMSYVFPLIDINSSNNSDKGSSGKNMLIVTPDSAQSVKVSDRLAVFNKYHEINEATIKDRDEDIDNEANVIIGSPDLLLDIAAEGRVDLSKTNILVVDDINLIKKQKQLPNLEKILETQGVLDKILKAPEEIKVDKTKEQEAERNAQAIEARTGRQPRAKNNACRTMQPKRDPEAEELVKKYNSFNGKTPEFILNQGIVVNID